MLNSLQESGTKGFTTSIKQSKRKIKEESSLIKACLTYLTLRGYLAIRNNTGVILIPSKTGVRAVKMGIPGASDIIACSPEGQFIAIECKSRKGKLTKTQLAFLEKVKKLGGKALVVRSIDDLIYQLS